MSYPIRGPQSAQVIRRPRCPMCDTLNVKCYSTRPPAESEDGTRRMGVRYYECNECMGFDQKPTRFKVHVV